MRSMRNFSIIAHVNHGKSTLSDRIIQICGGTYDSKIKNQILDSMILERERGITIKSQSVTLNYKSQDGKIYQLNFIDTPGHVDFSYEVSRSLSACEGALLVIDACQGIEAQTVAHCYAAIDMGLEIIPVLNKVDLPIARPDCVAKEIEDIIGIDTSNIVLCSAKTGRGVLEVLEQLICSVPSPKGDPDAPLQALIIDSWFDNYLGVISLICIKNGNLHRGDKIKIMSTGNVYNVNRLGIFTPKQNDRSELRCGEVGWLACSIKNSLGAPVGDTLTDACRPANRVLPGFKKVKPQVYAGLFPMSQDNYAAFRNALDKLSLNDASLFYEPENSSALGFGFRCGFLGLLHMEVIQERLRREYNLDLIITAPTVIYEIETVNKEIVHIDNPSKLPPSNKINILREPIAECRILLPREYLGNVIKLCMRRRGTQISIYYYGKQVSLIYDIPMAEVVLDFFDRLKSASRGYASLDYSFKCFQTSNIVRIDILINGECIDALASFSHNENAVHRAHELVDKIKTLIPRHQFDIIVQAAIGKRIIARSTIKQLRKNVLSKCYGGDVSRKKKLLQKQKAGKKRMKQIGSISLPSEVFLVVLHAYKN